jgi:hypothetical protein
VAHEGQVKLQKRSGKGIWHVGGVGTQQGGAAFRTASRAAWVLLNIMQDLLPTGMRL